MAIEVKWSRNNLDADVICDCAVCKKGQCKASMRAEDEAEKTALKNRNKERARQEKLLAGKRSKAKDAASAKIGDTIPARRFKIWYDGYAKDILDRTTIFKENENGESVETTGPFLNCLNMISHKGDAIYEVIRPLPDKNTYERLRSIRYEITIGGLVSDAFGEIESLAGEMRDWYDNMPEGFQNGSKGEEVNECADALENISAVEMPDSHKGDGLLSDYKVVYLPPLRISSRSDRLHDALEMLRFVVGILRDEIGAAKENPDAKLTAEDRENAKHLADEIETEIGSAEDVCFPGMY